jgi:hypothetical protein
VPETEIGRRGRASFANAIISRLPDAPHCGGISCRVGIEGAGSYGAIRDCLAVIQPGTPRPQSR